MVSIVSFRPKTREFEVEEAPVGPAEPELSTEALRSRLLQQRILADFGVLALKGTPFPELLQDATKQVAEGLKADFAKAMKYLPAENRLLVCAGVGWAPGVIGTATVGADLASPAGYALRTGKAVISNHLEIEERFRTPELLVENGVRRAINVVLQGEGTPFGVLEVDSQSEGEFTEADIVFLQGIANILGMAIERQRVEGNLRNAVERHQLLIKEANHRVNNSLQIVASMLHLQASGSANDALSHELREASNRVAAIARAHQRLYSDEQIDKLDLAIYLHDVCQDLAQAMPRCAIEVNAEPGIVLRTDRAIPAVLLLSELITNAAKYAYPSGNCKVWVSLSRTGTESLIMSVRDEGVGVPAGFDIQNSERLGMRLVRTFTQQLQGNLELLRRDPGTEFVLRIPLDPLSR